GEYEDPGARVALRGRRGGDPQGRRRGGSGREDHRPRRTVGGGQEHPSARREPADRTDRGRDLPRRATDGRDGPPEAAASGRDGLPTPGPLRPVGRGGHPLRCAPRRAARGRGAPAGVGGPGPFAGVAGARDPLRRPAAAGLHSQGPRPRARGAPHGRTHERPGRGRPPQGGRPRPRAQRQTGADDGLRESRPRPGRARRRPRHPPGGGHERGGVGEGRLFLRGRRGGAPAPLREAL
ncbi:MAG: Phosphate transport ATP-binding protein PstB, partial [uncultured Rubrobacteraceae bacterium]